MNAETSHQLERIFENHQKIIEKQEQLINNYERSFTILSGKVTDLEKLVMILLKKNGLYTEELEQ